MEEPIQIPQMENIIEDFLIDDMGRDITGLLSDDNKKANEWAVKTFNDFISTDKIRQSIFWTLVRISGDLDTKVNNHREYDCHQIKPDDPDLILFNRYVKEWMYFMKHSVNRNENDTKHLGFIVFCAKYFNTPWMDMELRCFHDRFLELRYHALD